LMRASEIYKSINRKAASTFLLFLMLSGCAMADFMARERMLWSNRHFFVEDDRAVQEMSIIDFISAHHWMAFVYVAVFLSSLWWLEFRHPARWVVWVTFGLMALPCLAYGRACLHVGMKFIDWAPAEQ